MLWHTQGLLGGFALLNFFMTYMLYSGQGLTEFLRYYGYLATVRAYIHLCACICARACMRVWACKPACMSACIKGERHSP